MQVDNDDANVCMMEGCTEADLLPAKCGKCHRRFCTRHLSYADHNCDRNYGAQLVSCPVCGASVPCAEGQDPNVVVSRHIDNGCRTAAAPVVERAFPTHEQRVRGVQASERHNYCSYHNCQKNELVLLLCEKCGQSFCVDHRTPAKHDCPARTLLPPVRHRFPNQQKANHGQSPNEPRNTKAQPIGSYKGDSALVCLVYLDKTSPNSPATQTTSQPSSYYFRFSAVAVIGRAIDQYCAAVDMLSANLTEQWYFYNVSRGCVLLEAQSVAGEVVAEGDVLWCTREATLRPEVREALERGLSNISLLTRRNTVTEVVP